MKSTIVFFTLFLLISCRNDKVTPIEVECPDLISFSQDLEPLFINTCSTSGCHDATATSGYNLMGYDNIAAVDSDSLLGVIRHDFGAPMPFGQPKWADSSIVKLQCWLKQGKLDN